VRTRIFAVVTAATAVAFSLTASAQAHPVRQAPSPGPRRLLIPAGPPRVRGRHLWPTEGLSHAKAAAIARFIGYAAGPGQAPGLRPGRLPAGFLPLTPALRAQARKAAQEVLHQTGGG
jgi:hypothetical protein